MSIVTGFTFNAFQENTYIIKDEKTDRSVIIDPGCHSEEEKQEILTHIKDNHLDISAIINTHCHADHVFGNAFLKQRFPDAPLCIHKGELIVLESYPAFAAMYGIPAEPSPKPDQYFEDGEIFTFGETKLKVFFTPGHSPASLSFYNEEDGYIIGGDVLFRQSIGRTDLPGGDYATLITSIKNHFLSLPDNVVVYSGHGPDTTIGFERRNNPFLNQ
ncbi:MAG: MBL fold metallo-hydrolase [Saprospiraceae bacterium]|nr:MBL fold metallo-hydrolase [Saprospiraceae bacterium]